MARAIADIQEDIRALTDEQRFELLRSLIGGLDGPEDADVNEAWLAEAERRDREIESGDVQSIPAYGVFREAHQLLRR